MEYTNHQQRRIKILLLHTSVGSGGAARVMTHLFNNLSRDKFEVYFAVLQVHKDFVNNFDPTKKNFYNLSSSRARSAIVPLYKLMKQIKPNVVLTAKPELNMVISLIRTLLSKKTKFIMRETSIASVREYSLHPFFYRTYFRVFVRMNDLIICPGESMAKDLISVYSVPRNKIKIINNPVDFNELHYPKKTVDSFDVLVVSAFRKEKGISRFIDSTKYMDPSISIGIIGNGPEEKFIRDLILKNEIGNITLLGFKSDPISYMKKAKVVVLPSFYEGFSNTLIESISVGTPIIAFDAPGGNSEIINHNMNGYLVPDGDIRRLAAYMEKAIHQSWDREKISALAFEKYNLHEIMKQYESAIENVINK